MNANFRIGGTYLIQSQKSYISNEHLIYTGYDRGMKWYEFRIKGRKAKQFILKKNLHLFDVVSGERPFKGAGSSRKRAKAVIQRRKEPKLQENAVQNVLKLEQGGEYQIKLTDLGTENGAYITDGLAEVKRFLKDINTYLVVVDDVYPQALSQEWLDKGYVTATKVK